MQKSATGMNRNLPANNAGARGFSLIEILVVILIVGIAAGFALLAFGDFGAARRATVMAEQFASYIKMVQQRAILEMNTLGINITPNGYQTYRFQQGTTWQPMSKNSPFRWQNFPSSIVVTFKSNIKNTSKEPDIIINSSGDMTEFVLYFGNTRQARITTLVGQHDGSIVLTTGSS